MTGKIKNADCTCLHFYTDFYNNAKCDLLDGCNDCTVCDFYCDSKIFKYGVREYHGTDCIYIERRKDNE